MTLGRYEVRLNGILSDRARGAFYGLDVVTVPPQTILLGDLAEMTDLADVLALCRAMGLEVVSLRRLPDAAAAGDEGPDLSVQRPAPHHMREGPPQQSDAEDEHGGEQQCGAMSHRDVQDEQEAR
jgi:hypothetical protein